MIDAPSIIQFFGTVAVAVLFVVIVALSLKRNQHLFLATGQTVCKWASCVLATVVVSRILVYVGLLGSEPQKTVNSVIFCFAVIGMVWSVMRHAKS